MAELGIMLVFLVRIPVLILNFLSGILSSEFSAEESIYQAIKHYLILYNLKALRVSQHPVRLSCVALFPCPIQYSVRPLGHFNARHLWVVEGFLLRISDARCTV